MDRTVGCRAGTRFPSPWHERERSRREGERREPPPVAGEGVQAQRIQKAGRGGTFPLLSGRGEHVLEPVSKSESRQDGGGLWKGSFRVKCEICMNFEFKT